MYPNCKMDDDNVFTLPKCNAWDVSALLSMDLRQDVQPGCNTWRDFLMSLHHFVTTIMREARRLAGIVPYRTIPYPNAGELIHYVVAMKSQYTLMSDICKVRVGIGAGRLGVFATTRLEPGNVITTFPVDALYLKRNGGVMLTPNNEEIDPRGLILRNTRHDDVFLASSLLYLCPERCGHVIYFSSEPNVMVDDLFDGVMYVVRVTHPIDEGGELFLSD